MIFRLFALLFLAAAPPAHAGDDAAPLFAANLVDLDDRPATLSAYKGRPLVVNFWARWCVPCREEIPELIRMRAKHKAGGVEVIGISLEDSPAAVREYAKAYEIDYPVLVAKGNGIELMKSLGNARAGLPFTLAIDRGGKVAYTKLGLLKKADAEAAFGAAK